MAKFRKLYKEKIYNEKRKARKYVLPFVVDIELVLTTISYFFFSRDRNEVRHILRRFPNVSKDLLAKKYPHVDLAKILRNDEGRGHFASEQ